MHKSDNLESDYARYLIVWHEKRADSTVWSAFCSGCVVFSFILKMGFSVLPEMN